MFREVFVSITLAILSNGAASAQALEHAGREGGVRYAIDRENTSRQSDGIVLAQLYEVRDRPRGDEGYALIAAYYDCANGSRSVRVREAFSSRRDPVKTIYSPSQVTFGRDSPAVAEQLRLVCGESRRTGSIDLTEFLRRR